MSDDHTGIYICLIVLIVICALILVVLVANSHFEWPKAQEQANPFVALTAQMSVEQKLFYRNSIVVCGIVAIGALLFSVIFSFKKYKEDY